MLDYYRILKTPFNASQKALKAAYIKRLKQFHPDIYKGADATAKTQKINEAYQTLKNPEKRAAYDRHWRAAHKAWQNSGAGGGDDAELAAQIEAEFRLRQRVLHLRINQIIDGLYADIAQFRGKSLHRAAQKLREAVKQDLSAHKQRLLAENTLYYANLTRHYESFARPALRDAARALTERLKQIQQDFISQSMDEALPQLLAAAEAGGKNMKGSYAGAAAGAKREAARQRGAFSAEKSYAPLWWGFGLALFCGWPVTLGSVLAFIFGARTSGKGKFLLGSLLGLILHMLFFYPRR